MSSEAAGPFISVFDIDQIKALRRGGCAGIPGTIAGSEDFRDRFGLEGAASNEHKCANQVAYHVVQKSVAGDGVDELVAVAQPARRNNRADVRGFLVGEALAAIRIDGCERSEIVGAFDEGSGSDDGGFVAWIRMVPDVA